MHQPKTIPAFFPLMAVCAAAICCLAGCGGERSAPAHTDAQTAQDSTGDGDVMSTAAGEQPGEERTPRDHPARSTQSPPNEADSDGAHRNGPQSPSSEESTASALPPLNAAAIAREAIRTLESKHLVLYTDLPSNQEIDRLPALFDRAAPQWASYFRLDAARLADWRMRGFLIGDQAKFQRAGLLPSTLPNFQNGFSTGYQLWLYEQPTDYYRRHLLFHEGTHGFMNTMLGGSGPGWYMEGTAELLGTHALAGGELKLGYFPADREQVAMLGRIKLVQDAYAAGNAKSITAILATDNRFHLESETYAWCWALAAFLDGHPRYRDRFRTLPQHVRDPHFNQRFVRLFIDDLRYLTEEWQVFIATLEHGYDIEATAIDFTPGEPLVRGPMTTSIAANRGWQNSGIELKAGETYRLAARGRYQVADQPEIWWCEPGGVTIRYYQGRPLGMLLATVFPDKVGQVSHPAQDENNLPSPFLQPAEIGLEASLTPPNSGTLFFRINDSAGELGDNAGQLEVTVSAD